MAILLKGETNNTETILVVWNSSLTNVFVEGGIYKVTNTRHLCTSRDLSYIETTTKSNAVQLDMTKDNLRVFITLQELNTIRNALFNEVSIIAEVDGRIKTFLRVLDGDVNSKIELSQSAIVRDETSFAKSMNYKI